MNSSKSKEITRVQKLMALAENGQATENEAILALEKANQIIKEHMISQAELNSKEQTYEQQSVPKVKNMNFTSISSSIGALFNCLFMQTGPVQEYYGEPGDVMAAVSMRFYLCTTIATTATSYRRELLSERCTSSPYLRDDVEAFRRGMEHRIIYRIAKLIQERSASLEETTGKDLAVIWHDRNLQAYKEKTGIQKFKQIRHKKPNPQSGSYREGWEAGKSVSLDQPKQLTDKAPKQIGHHGHLL